MTGFNSTAGDKTRRRREKELLHCHTFGESHRKQRRGAGKRTSGTFRGLTGFQIVLSVQQPREGEEEKAIMKVRGGGGGESV